MIFLNLLNRIFGPKKPLSRQEIDDYKAGTGNMNDIETKTVNSDFNDQAMKGWGNSSVSVNEGMYTSDKKMTKFINQGNVGGSSQKGMTLSFILFTLTMFALIIFTYQGNTAVEKKPEVAEIIQDESKRSEEIDFYTAISPEKQITSNELIKNQEIKNTKKPTTEFIEIKTEENKVESKNIDTEIEEDIRLPIQSSGKIQNSTKSGLVYKNAKEVYLSDLKNVDYRAYRNRPIKVRNALEVGIPANQSTKDDIQEFPSLQTTEITYIDYLSTSSQYFSSRQFKKALKHYLTILDTYPDDVNANFYGGLCYFNLGQFNQSSKLLRKSYTLGYGNFREEANWFSAKAQIEQNNIIKARYLLSIIVKEKGFYKDQATELLKEVKEK